MLRTAGRFMSFKEYHSVGKACLITIYIMDYVSLGKEKVLCALCLIARLDEHVSMNKMNPSDIKMPLTFSFLYRFQLEDPEA